MALSQIRRIDAASRSVVLALEDGREMTVTLPQGANIEVLEPCTMRTMEGTLEDLQVGYWEEATLQEQAPGACSCSSIVSVS